MPHLTTAGIQPHYSPFSPLSAIVCQGVIHSSILFLCHCLILPLLSNALASGNYRAILSSEFCHLPPFPGADINRGLLLLSPLMRFFFFILFYFSCLYKQAMLGLYIFCSSYISILLLSRAFAILHSISKCYILRESLLRHAHRSPRRLLVLLSSPDVSDTWPTYYRCHTSSYFG